MVLHLKKIIAWISSKINYAAGEMAWDVHFSLAHVLINICR
ncbi:hypothetical protein GPLA_2144 [Paraglaciecola polaris LMG 21857]|uniref:Uncharacterized protein n=1 Tax=Paraglaciecola polaris LMG 21857 TaxID=1129793 RepID=K6YK07_9ALTE|nr:hypothetical protein GPLA_2144 [Paraglaciecola polaris LMG 21857]